MHLVGFYSTKHVVGLVIHLD